LIRRAQQGEVDALAELYRRHASTIFRYFAFRTHDLAVAADLTGEVFLKMVEGLNGYVDRGVPFVAWLFHIARARMADHYRHSARHPTTSLSDLVVDKGANPESEAADQADLRRLAEGLSRLTDEQKRVIQLRFIEGYSLEEAARIMNKTTGAVKALQHRALQSLARQLKP
jgi:RNA polymerase sigma-70 factor (ECF subfamily)